MSHTFKSNLQIELYFDALGVVSGLCFVQTFGKHESSVWVQPSDIR